VGDKDSPNGAEAYTTRELAEQARIESAAENWESFAVGRDLPTSYPYTEQAANEYFDHSDEWCVIFARKLRAVE